MSYQAVNWVLKHSCSAGAARLVLLSIASHADEFGLNSWPSQKTIAKESNLSEFWVSKAVGKLVALGELKALPPSKTSRVKSYRYSLPLVSPQICLPIPAAVPPQPRCPPTALPPTALQKPPNLVGVNRSEPSFQNIKASEIEPTAEIPILHVPDSVPIGPWMAFVGMCRRKGRTVDREAVPLLKRRLLELEAQGHSPGAVLEQSVMHGWLSLHPLEDERRIQKNGNSQRLNKSPAAVVPDANRKWKQPTVLSNVH